MDSLPLVGLDCQKRSRSGLCSKLPAMRSVGDIALCCFAKVNVNKVALFYANLRYRISSSCKLFLSMYTFTIDNAFICIAKRNTNSVIG